jgi:ABC-type protease/lipase transport system fused ATPase/permease subunit
MVMNQGNIEHFGPRDQILAQFARPAAPAPAAPTPIAAGA